MTKFLLLILIFFSLMLPKPVRADADIQSNYNVNYTVTENGQTLVNEKITMTNKTEKFYPSGFSVSIGSTKLTQVSASDDNGALEVTTTPSGSKTKIEVKFKDVPIGLNKTYTWTLRFASGDFAEKQGRVWQVTLPKITIKDDDSYNFSLSVPSSFGNFTSIAPQPTETSFNSGVQNFRFNSKEVIDQGVFASFGSTQIYDFTLKYKFDNSNKLLPAIAKVPLPANNNYQQVTIDSFSTKPENVTVDDDGNTIAVFKIDKSSVLEVSVLGVAKLNINPSVSKLDPTKFADYTKADQYWQVGDAIIKRKLTEILKSNPSSVREKARLINNYVVDTLSYSDERAKEKEIERLGALGALSNPTEAVCSEYTDLFVTLARAAGIPARRLEGYAYSSNQTLRPLSLQNALHAWPEYYDGENWIMIDPTWQNTSGGVDYFSKFDLNHITFSVLGESSTDPSNSVEANVSLRDANFSPNQDFKMSIDAPKAFFSGFSNDLSLQIENTGNVALPAASISARLSKHLISPDQKSVEAIPPGGVLSIPFRVLARSVLENSFQTVNFSYLNKEINKSIEFRSIFVQFKGLLIGFLLTVTLIIIYVLKTIISRRRSNVASKN